MRIVIVKLYNRMKYDIVMQILFTKFIEIELQGNMC